LFALTESSVKGLMQEISIVTEHEPVYGQAAGRVGDRLVVGVHGWSQRNGWHTWAPLLQPLGQAGFYVVCIDMPGWGKSRSWSDEPMNRDQGIEALEAVIAGLGYQQASFMGKSWGGGLALELALQRPEIVQGLILSAPAFRDFDRLPGLTRPVLLAWSKDDPVIPFSYASRFVETLPVVELVAFEAGGHSAGPKNADTFSPKAIDFLNSI
jgi:pimeloyl-ACP methyl ester carboxylesterase